MLFLNICYRCVLGVARERKASQSNSIIRTKNPSPLSAYTLAMASDLGAPNDIALNPLAVYLQPDAAELTLNRAAEVPMMTESDSDPGVDSPMVSEIKERMVYILKVYISYI